MTTDRPQTEGRTLALKFLFSKISQVGIDKTLELSEDFSKLEEDFNEFLESYASPDEENPGNDASPQAVQFAWSLIKGLLEKGPELIEQINEKLLKKSFSALGVSEQAMLLLALQEKLVVNTPKPVLISEYLKLASQYARADAVNFLNGILDGLYS